MGLTDDAEQYFRENPDATTYDARMAGFAGRTARRARANVVKTLPKTAPRVLVFDIETSPMEFYGWGLYEQRPSIDQIIKDWAILTWSAKWLFDSNIIHASVAPEEAVDRTDNSVIKELWGLFETADILIAHNGDAFDVRKANARFFINGLGPPLPYTTIDTVKHSRKNFAFSSHKLDFLGELAANKKKIKTDYDLWKRCVGHYGLDESAKALAEMQTYNDRDVTLLEEVYLELRPWMKSHPNMGCYVDTSGSVCPNCAGKIKKEMWRGNYYTPAGRFKSFRCECGAIGRSRYSDISADDRKNLVVGAAR